MTIVLGLPIFSTIFKMYPSSSTNGEHASYTGANKTNKYVEASLVKPVSVTMAWSLLEAHTEHHGLMDEGNKEIYGILLCLIYQSLLLRVCHCECLLHDLSLAHLHVFNSSKTAIMNFMKFVMQQVPQWSEIM